MNEYRHDVFSSWRYSFITLRSDRVGAKRIHYASLRLYRSESVSRSDFDRCDVFTSQRRKSLREFDIATTQLRRGDIHIHCDVFTSQRTSLRRDGKHRVAAITVAAMGNHRYDCSSQRWLPIAAMNKTNNISFRNSIYFQYFVYADMHTYAYLHTLESHSARLGDVAHTSPL